MDFRTKLKLLYVALLMTGFCPIISIGQIPFDRVVIDANGPKDPFGKTAGDIDGDGYADLVEGGRTSGGLVWYKNPVNPFARWKKYMIKEGAGFGTEHEIADIDNDSRPDLVVIQKGSFVWLKNDGTPEDGSWKETLISETELHDIEVGDFDGDGDMDIVARNQSEWGNDGNILHFYEQITPDKWAHSTRGCPHGEGLLAVDLDGDGKKDAVTGNRWYKNPGKMNAAEWKEYTISNSWNEGNVFIGEGDLSGDGLVDLVLVPSERLLECYRISWFEQPRVLYGECIEHVLEDSVQSDYHFGGCADFNLDGNPDIVMAEMHHGDNPDEVSIYENRGKGKKWTKNIIWDGGSHSCRVFDCDNDGDPDFFGSNYLGTEVNLWVNRAVSPAPLSFDKWSYLQLDSLRSQKVFGLTAGDLNNDGLDDIASGKWVYFNPGGNMAGKWIRQELPVDVDVLLYVNIDNDAWPDLIAEDGKGQVFWLEMKDYQGKDWYYRIIGNVGAGNHRLSSQGYILAQIEAGSKPEIVIVGGEQPEGAIYCFKIPKDPVNDEWPRIVVATPVYPDGIGCADIDLDGNIDLCTNAGSNKQQAWYENPGTWKGDWKKHSVGSLNGADRFAAADVDGDGNVDIVASGANQDENGVYWFKSPGNPVKGEWVRHTVVYTGKTNSMNSLDVADMDLDGDIDIVSGTHRGELKVTVWKNDGKGNFTGHIAGKGKESHLGSRLYDLDGDGDLDIVSIGWDKSQYLHLWRNDAIKK